MARAFKDAPEEDSVETVDEKKTISRTSSKMDLPVIKSIIVINLNILILYILI